MFCQLHDIIFINFQSNESNLIKSTMLYNLLFNDKTFYKTQVAFSTFFPAGIYFFKVGNGNTRTMWNLFKVNNKDTPDRRHWRRSGVFVVNFEQTSNCSGVSIVEFEKLSASWVSAK